MSHSKLQILSKRLVTTVFAGAYKSVFRGRGLEFDGLSEYQPGDDIRTIDWNVTARTGQPFVKRFVEEREMTVMLMLDQSASLNAESPRPSKKKMAAEISTLLATVAANSNDLVGLLTFAEKVKKYIPPAKGVRHSHRLIAEIASIPDASGSTDLASALVYLQNVTRRRLIIFLISDFITPDFTLELTPLARRHDVVAVSINDPFDLNLPDVGLLQVLDVESGQQRVIDTSSAKVRAAYATQAAYRQAVAAKAIRGAGAELLVINTTETPINALSRFFHSRKLRRGYH